MQGVDGRYKGVATVQEMLYQLKKGLVWMEAKEKEIPIKQRGKLTSLYC